MALRYRKSVKLGKGVKLNIGKKSAGISLGGKYGGVSFNTRSGARVRTSAPGTGLSYTQKVSAKNGAKKRFKDFEDFSDVDNEGFADEIAEDETAPVETPKKKKHVGVKIFVGLVLLVALVEACGGDEKTPVTTPAPTEKIIQTTEPKSTTKPNNYAPAVVPEDNEKAKEMVWVSKSGKKYHSSQYCSNMESPKQIDISEAKTRGLTPCSKCGG